eukprot:TRINITY_DN16258_c0_g1_i1.p1 TRINITY_DN16258_c0_g1~~TRINITY_DN16258_c0_g1_i1.p1  ORF type:complete len:417 (+),score=79.27 TRINITY_DN16258_c0_g1_i1:92-1342(+)
MARYTFTVVCCAVCCSILVPLIAEAAREARVAATAVEKPKPNTLQSPTQYYGLVRVGTPPQEFRVVFDTSSGGLILPGDKCDDRSCTAPGRRLFMPKKSSTSAQIGWADEPTKDIGDDDSRDTRSLNLLGSDVTGEFARDKVCFGGKGRELCGTADFLALIEETDEPFGSLDFDGVLGLAPTNGEAAEFSILRALLPDQSGNSHRSIVAVHLGPPGSRDGEIVFGGFRRGKLDSDPLWAPLSSTSSWQVGVDDVFVGNRTLGLCAKTGCQAIVDTGSSLVMLPGVMLLKLMDEFGFKEDCPIGGLPSFGIVVGGHRLEIPAEDLVERENDGTCRLLLESTPASITAGSTAGSGADGGHTIAALVLGYPFLRRQHALLDVKRGVVGFAPAARSFGIASDSTSLPAGATSVELVGVRP